MKPVKPEKKSSNFSEGTKMRIKLFSNGKGLVEDRLVEQATELRIGPKHIHSGPMTIEFNLATQDDVDGMTNYIKKLKGFLPIEEKAKKPKTSKLDKMLKEKEPLEDLLKLVEGKCKTQEALITELRQYDFRFIAADVINDLASKDQLTLEDRHQDWQFMVRMVKEAKVPQNDKYDWRLVFGIKFVGEKHNYVVVYLWGKKDHTHKIPWETPKKMNFKKVEKIYIFPPMMDYTDRKKWRIENRKIIKAAEDKKELVPSKFYTKWSPYIKVH
jgi:hypothetical protein